VKRKIICGVPVALFVVGLIVLLFARLQPCFIATVPDTGRVGHTSSKRRVKGRSKAHYSAELMVRYKDRLGNEATAKVEFITTNPDAIPKAGDAIPVSRGVAGIVTHPNRSLIALGGSAAFIGGLFLFMFGLAWLSLRRNKQ